MRRITCATHDTRSVCTAWCLRPGRPGGPGQGVAARVRRVRVAWRATGVALSPTRVASLTSGKVGEAGWEIRRTGRVEEIGGGGGEEAWATLRRLASRPGACSACLESQSRIWISAAPTVVVCRRRRCRPKKIITATTTTLTTRATQ